MNVDGIIANVIDRCGGSQLAALDVSIPTLHVHNKLEIYGLELSNTFKGSYGIKRTEVWTTKEGAMQNDSLFTYRPQYVRIRSPLVSGSTNMGGWAVLNVKNNIDEITQAENISEPAVFFHKIKPFNYILSWAPPQPLTVEIWGQWFDPTFATLAEVPKLPEEFSQLIAVEAALVTLDDLLLLDDSAKVVRFVSMRKETYAAEKRQLLPLWTNFKAREENRNSDDRRKAYNIFEQDDEEGINPVTLFQN